MSKSKLGFTTIRTDRKETIQKFLDYAADTPSVPLYKSLSTWIGVYRESAKEHQAKYRKTGSDVAKAFWSMYMAKLRFLLAYEKELIYAELAENPLENYTLTDELVNSFQDVA